MQLIWQNINFLNANDVLINHRFCDKHFMYEQFMALSPQSQDNAWEHSSGPDQEETAYAFVYSTFVTEILSCASARDGNGGVTNPIFFALMEIAQTKDLCDRTDDREIIFFIQLFSPPPPSDSFITMPRLISAWSLSLTAPFDAHSINIVWNGYVFFCK